jgi:hypothetical protein
MLGFSVTENLFLFTYHLITIYYLISSITLRDASSDTAPLPECTALEITAVATTGRSAEPPPRPPPASFSRSAPIWGPQRPSPPASPAHQDRVPPIVTCICWNHRILSVSASANQAYSRAKFLFVCFTGRVVSISFFSQNPSWSAKMKFPRWSKLFSCFRGCLPCSNCSTNVSCCGTSMITNNYGGQELERQATASNPALLPDLISM